MDKRRGIVIGGVIMILLGLVIFAGWSVQQRKIAYARQEYVRVAEAGKAASESGTEGID